MAVDFKELSRRIANRQTYNREMVEMLGKTDFPTKYPDHFKVLKSMVEQYPDQRMGQIFANYICPDFQNSEVSVGTQDILNKLFPGQSDPFFEESFTTHRRWSNEL